MFQNYFAVSFPLWILREWICTGFYWPIWATHGRVVSVLLQNEEGIFNSLINNLHCRGQAGQRFLSEGDWSWPAINTTFLSFWLSLQTPSVWRLDFFPLCLSTWERKCLFMIWSQSWRHFLDPEYVLKTQTENHFNYENVFPCCWCIMLNKPFGVFTVGTA